MIFLFDVDSKGCCTSICQIISIRIYHTSIYSLLSILMSIYQEAPLRGVESPWHRFEKGEGWTCNCCIGNCFAKSYSSSLQLYKLWEILKPHRSKGKCLHHAVTHGQFIPTTGFRMEADMNCAGIISDLNILQIHPLHPLRSTGIIRHSEIAARPRRAIELTGSHRCVLGVELIDQKILPGPPIFGSVSMCKL